MRLNELKNKLKRLTLQVIEGEVNRIISTDEELIKLKKNEFASGKRPDGSIIGTYRSLSYRRRKQVRNPRAGGFVDLIDKGGFTRKLFTQKIAKRKYIFFSTDPKAAELFSKYKGKSSLQGLNQAAFNRRQREYMPMLNRRLRSKVGL